MQNTIRAVAGQKIDESYAKRYEDMKLHIIQWHPKTEPTWEPLTGRYL